MIDIIVFKETKISISILVKLKRLQWAGHVERKDERRIPKRVMTGLMFGRKRYMDSVKEDSYQLLQCKNWHRRVLNRQDWRSRIKKAQACHGM